MVTKGVLAVLTPPPDDDDGVGGPTARSRLTRRQRGGLVAASLGLLVAMLLLGGLVIPRGHGADPAPGGLVYVIPVGRAESLREPGVDSALEIPTDIRFASPDQASITVRNEDTVTHRAGPFVVAAGQTLVQRFQRAGTYPFACAVDPSESIVVTVAQ